MKRKNVLCIFIFLVAFAGVYFFGTGKVETPNGKIKASELKVLENVVQEKTTPIPAPTPQVEKIATVPEAKSSWVTRKINAIKAQAKNLNTEVLKISLLAYQKAQERGLTSNPLVTIIDYSKPSTERRLWVVDVKNQKVIFNTLVAHGKNSGNVNATSFSNKESSLKSSIGVFLTDEVYTGKHGGSLKVRGLEAGINDNAYARSIVFHGAKYVSNSIAKSTGRIGRSFGCMAVSQDMIAPIVKAIKDKALVVIYYPDKNWLKKSSFLS